ncbi:SMP-30/gluconolactonase/LRE family protein [Marinoscillum sp. MHG1-6]|uniref:SMP-30/gluconolactonase/LRE family protein n=1 Tax=Marinoscillum sp. MHG1-6 TaxID=2959627 RepID=UPI00215754C8|nr:SMP-30/gluconolactonase/LRE family protein [Marinoscillum sp. MHG1-6]
MKYLILLFTFFGFSWIAPAQNNNEIIQKDNITFPELLVFSDQFEEFFSSKNKIEKIVSDKFWLEGPVWVDALNGILFSDIPENKIYFWNSKTGLSVWLEPSGFANGLLLDGNRDLLLMQGNYQSTNYTMRQIGKIINPKSNKKIIDFVKSYEGKKFNSPNDIALGSNGILYFTDPVYGLTNGDWDELKELSFNGVYKIENNNVQVLIDSLKSPNGIGVSPDNKFLYVSDSETGRLLCYELDDAGDIVKSTNFFNLQEMWKHTIPSTVLAWDGMAVTKEGVIVAAGWGGVWFISPRGVLLAHIQTPNFTSNTAIDDKGEYLYWTAGKIPFTKGSSVLYRYKLK